MTRPLKRSFTLLFTTLVGSLLLLSPIASAQSSTPHPLEVAPFEYQSTGGEVEDVSSSWYDKFFASDSNWLNRNRYASTLESFTAAKENGTWGLYQSFGSSSGSPYKSIVLFWSKPVRSPLKISASHGSSVSYYSLALPSDNCFYSMSFVSGKVINHFGSGSSFSCGVINLNTLNNKIIAYSGEYTLEPSATGYVDTIPKASLTPASASSGWNDNCGIDVGCHMGNIGNSLKSFFDFFMGIFLQGDNNSLLKLFKDLFVPKNPSALFDFSALSDYFHDSLRPVFSSIDFLKAAFGTLYPASPTKTAFCHVGHSYYDPSGFNSSGHLYIIDATFFGAPFKPDLCSFERMVGGIESMSRIRVFTGSILFIISIILWQRFIARVAEERF